MPSPSIPSHTSTSTSTSSQKYNLPETSTAQILVYKHRSGPLYLTTPRDLCRTLDKESPPNSPVYRCSRIPIPRGASRVDVLQRDLFNEPEKSQYAKYPNQSDSIASVRLPSRVYWGRLLFGEFEELYILSPDRSAGSSPRGSGRSSEPVSPN